MPTQPKGSHYFAKQSFAELNIREYTVRRSSRAPAQHCPSHNAGVAELVDAPDSKSGFFGSGGSIPPLGTINTNGSSRFLVFFVLRLLRNSLSRSETCWIQATVRIEIGTEWKSRES